MKPAPVLAAVALLLFPCASCRRGEAGSQRAEDHVSVAPGWFTDITAQSGIHFVHDPGALADFEAPRVIGAGAACFDFDNDGDLDIYFINGGKLRRDSPGIAATNRLYRQEPDGTFRDVTEASGLGDTGYGMGCAVGDYDNDGDLDVYVTNFGQDVFYRNNGDGSFSDVTEAVGIAGERWSSSVSFLDYDRDGFLDLYVASYFAYRSGKTCTDFVGRQEFCGPAGFPGVADVLYHNEGGQRFRDVSREAGLTGASEAGLGVYCGDLDDDGWVDVYVANDADPNNLWINNGDGTFTDQGAFSGTAFNRGGQVEAGMGVAAGDVDGDGDLDLFVTHLKDESNTYYRNDGGRTFFDATDAVKLGNASMPYTGFGTAFLDYDHDGDLDLALVNGAVKRHRQPSPGDSPLPNYAEPNALFRNDGRGVFRLASDHGGEFVRRRDVSRGLVAADFDRDGDADLLVTSVGSAARLYRNDAPTTGHWLIVRAFNRDLHRDAVGARISALVAGRTLIRELQPSSGYLCAGDHRVHFGLGDADHVEVVRIRWSDGTIEDFGSDGVDRAVVLTKGEGRSPP